MDHILRIKEVQARIGLSQATIYRMVKAGTFPTPIRLSLNAVGWPASAVQKWFSDKMEDVGLTEATA